MLRLKVSIIVPVYNVESYILYCANSITNQSYDNLDIIFVDDGSSDLSGSILDKIALSDSRVRVIHKENEGVSKARNVGLDHAEGDFIMFVDSDDWIDENMVENMLDAATSYDVDIVGCGMRYVNLAGRIRENRHGLHAFNKKLNSHDSFVEIISELVYGGGSLCCRLINRDITNGIRFIESMRISEDQEWLLRVVKRLDSMIYIPQPLYNVRVRAGSATTKSKTSDVEDIEIVNQDILSWANNNNMAMNESVLNALYVRTRLQYSSAIRAGYAKDQLLDLKNRMIKAYAKTNGIHREEKIKYYISLLPPEVYLSTRALLKQIRNEG